MVRLRSNLRWRRSALSLGLLVVAGSLSGCLGWWAQLVTTDGASLRGIACPSATTCVAVGWTGPGGGNGRVEVTTDAGGHWASHQVDPPLDAVSCGDVRHCVAVGGSGTVVTQDGGTTWEPSTGATLPSGTSVSCPDATHCWALGSSQSVVASTDAGDTWSAQHFSVPATTGGPFGGPYTLGGVILRSISCPATAVCVAVGLAGYAWQPPPETTLPEQDLVEGLVMSTADGGLTWSAQLVAGHLGGNGGLDAVSCPTTQACLAIGHAPFDAGAYRLTSADGGSTWSASQVSQSQPVVGNGVLCGDAQHCLAVGAKPSAPSGAYDAPVMVSTDGGATWTPQAVPDPGATLHAVACGGPTSCWVVGDTASGALVLHTVTGGHAWPEVTGITPATGAPGGGTSVTITGTHLDLGVLSVSFGSVMTTAFRVDSPEQITVTAPAMADGASPTVDVSVNSLVGSSPLVPQDRFTYVQPPG